MRDTSLRFWILVATLVVVITSIHPNYHKYDIEQLEPCAQILSITNLGTHLDIDIGIATGGLRKGCDEFVEISFIPSIGDKIERGKSPGSRCIGIPSLSLINDNHIVNKTELDCLQLGKYMSNGVFLENPLRLHVVFDEPVSSLPLKRVIHSLAGDPHPDTIPFTGTTIKTNYEGLSGLSAINPDSNNVKIDRPMCTEYGYPGKVAYRKRAFSSLDARLMNLHLADPNFSEKTIASFFHKYGNIADPTSIGVDGEIEHDAAFDITVSKLHPLTPYHITTFKLHWQRIQHWILASQIGGGYFYPRDWDDTNYLWTQNKTAFETYSIEMQMQSSDDQCVIEMELLTHAIAVFSSIRDLLEVDSFADIPNIESLLGLTSGEIRNLEKHYNTMLRVLTTYMDDDYVSYPALFADLDRNKAEDMGVLYDRSFSVPDVVCENSNNNIVNCLTEEEWSKLFAINEHLGIPEDQHHTLKALHSSWEPMICKHDGDCLANTQWTCGGFRHALNRKTFYNRQSHNPSCKMWAPSTETPVEVYITGYIESNAGFTAEFSEVKINPRAGTHSATNNIITNYTRILDFFGIPYIVPGTLDVLVQTSFDTISPASRLLMAGITDKVHILQCGQPQSNGDFDGLLLTDNPYERHCLPSKFYPYSDNGHRGCTPFNLTSQRNFLFVPNTLVRGGAIGTSCGAMNYNSGEVGGSNTRKLQKKHGRDNLQGKPELSDIAGYFESPHFCSPGQTCARPSPCMMYNEQIRWSGYTGGLVEERTKRFKEEKEKQLANPFVVECYYGEHEQINSDLPHTVEGTIFSLYEGTRSTYQPYKYVEEELDSLRKELQNNPANTPENQLRLSTAKNKKFCSTATGYAYPQSLDGIMGGGLEDDYHPKVWIRTPPSGYIDKSNEHGIHNHRHPDVGHSFFTHRFNNPSPSPSPSPTPFTPSPTPTPVPSPLNSPSPVPSPTPFENKGPADAFRIFFKNNDGVGHLKSAAAYIGSLTLPVPLSRPIVGGFDAGCINFIPTSEVRGAYKVPSNTMAPLVGIVENDLTKVNNNITNMFMEDPKLIVTILCIPPQGHQCQEVEPTTSFVIDSCGNEISSLDVLLTQTNAPKDLVIDILSKNQGSLSSNNNHQVVQTLLTQALGSGSLIQMEWTQTQLPRDNFQWTIGFKPNSTDTTTTKVPLYQSYLSIVHPNIIVAYAPPFSPGDDIHTVRFRTNAERKYIPDPSLCIYDENMCTSSPSPSPPPFVWFPNKTHTCDWHDISCYHHKQTIMNCPLFYILIFSSLALMGVLIVLFYINETKQTHKHALYPTSGSEHTQGIQGKKIKTD